MKKIIILSGNRKWKTSIAIKDKKYRVCYEYLHSIARKNDIEIFHASYKWCSSDKTFFKYTWTYKNKKWQRARGIKPDLIYDKTNFKAGVHYFKKELEKNFKIINDPEFTLLADNKFYTSLIFPDFFKRYYKIFNKKDLLEISKKFKSKKIVLKPARGSGGDEIKIISKNNLSRFPSHYIKNGLIAQEFIDSSQGITNIIKGVHDLRLVFINEKIIYAYIRTPKRGSLLSNIAQGGKMTTIDPEKIPANVKPIINKIQDIFQSYTPRIFTIDLIFDKKQKPWIVELNTMPGIFFYPSQKKWMDKFYLELIKIFKENL